MLTLHPNYFRLRKPLERRIYEIARKHCGKKDEWRISLELLQKKCGSASTEKEFRRLVHRHCGERIRQQRVCPVHGIVESEQIVPGYQISDECYVPIDPDELEQIKPDSDKAISVHCFLDSHHVDPVYHTGRTLYLVPDGPPGQRPFCVLRDGMKATGRHAFSRLVIHRREQLALLRPFGRLLAVTFIEFPHRVRASVDYESEIRNVTPGANELGLVRQLIETMTDNAFELHRYRDRYMDQLSALIERRVAETDVTSTAKRAVVEDGADDSSLMAILEASLTAGVDDARPGNSTGIPRSRVVEENLQEQKSA